MDVRCTHCGTTNAIPDKPTASNYHCRNCGAFLPKPAPSPQGETSAAVGFIGGAALGAAVAGPVGAIVGAILGAIIGNEAKGVG